MNSQTQHSHPVDRRNVLTALAAVGAAGAVGAHGSRSLAAAVQENSETNADAFRAVRQFQSIKHMQQAEDLQPGDVIQTLGFYVPGDGGGAVYSVVTDKPEDDFSHSRELKGGRHANLVPGNSVNYRMFGAQGNGTDDDGVSIKAAHRFANQHQLPVVQTSGEFWITKTTAIPIRTNVEWGNTIFHIDERFNRKRIPRFAVSSQQERQVIELDDKQKESLLQRLKPGVHQIPELADYRNCLISIVDENDQIGFRSGDRYSGQSWDREELFYVEEDGRILGDIAWPFNDYTKLVATPCDDSFLVISGGGFYLSGDNPGEKYTGYYSNGFRVERSRTIIQNQWVGLEPGKRDVSLEPRSGFYTLSRVYNVTLENIRLIPWEQNRKDPKKRVGAGTYGISGNRMLNCTFRNLTAEGTWLHWGVFGTNLNKNFRIQRCRLNRVDVHFHCWNLTIQDSQIGTRGISVTGGGDLSIENTEQTGNRFLNLRRDFGGKWDGDISIRNCKLMPVSNGSVNVIYSHPDAADYGYPIGCARSITVENFQFDFTAAPDSESAVWMFQIAKFSKNKDNSRHFFPRRIIVRNVDVVGRDEGVRLIRIPDPGNYQLDRARDHARPDAGFNCEMLFENVRLEAIEPAAPDTAADVHFQLGSATQQDYADEFALYPTIRFVNCRQLCVFLGASVADATLQDCTVDRFAAGMEDELRGALTFARCRFAPQISDENKPVYRLSAIDGTHFSDCVFHAARTKDGVRPDLFDQLEIVQINKRVRHHQSNTALGREMLAYLQQQKTELQPAFISMLKSHHALESEQIAEQS